MHRSRVVLGSVAAAVALVGASAGASLAATSAHNASTAVSVSASEFKFTLSTKSIAKPGTVVFKVTNTGKEAHNFVVLSGINKATPLIQPTKSATLTVTFKKPGKYTYECTVGEHAAEGMQGAFIVK